MKLRRLLPRVHRYAGLVVSLAVLGLAISGVLLNHTHSLGLEQKLVDLPIVNRLYGVSSPQFVTSFSDGDAIASQWGDGIFFSDNISAIAQGRLIGIIRWPPIRAIATESQVILLMPDGQIVDRIDIPPSAGRARLIGRNATQLVVETESTRLLSDTDITAFYPAEGDMRSNGKASTTEPEIYWSQTSALSPALTAVFQDQLGLGGVSVERLLLDLHSGRLFGRIGVWLIDGAAALMVLLAFSGIWIWALRRK